MYSLRSKGRAVIALVLVSCLTHAFAHVGSAQDKAAKDDIAAKNPATTKPVLGALWTVGNKSILLNGNGLSSGTTVASGTRIQTPAGIGASVLFDTLGRVDIAPNTDLRLTFREDMVEVNLLAGCAILTVEQGVRGTVATLQGEPSYIGPDRRSFIDVCTGSTATAKAVIGEGAAAKAGAGVCGTICVEPLAVNSFNPLWLLFGASPLAFLGFIDSRSSIDTRPTALSSAIP